MPLSEDEQRILHEIERRFYAHDPESARRIESTTLPRYLARNCRWAALGFIAGLVVLVVSFASSWVLGVVGFVVMLASAFVFIQNLRRMGQHGWRQLTQSMKAQRFNEAWADANKRLRRRFGDDR
ncbi:MAG: DUF3040 domain-containing protein [Acidimicrobiales bacterium]